MQLLIDVRWRFENFARACFVKYAPAIKCLTFSGQQNSMSACCVMEASHPTAQKQTCSVGSSCNWIAMSKEQAHCKAANGEASSPLEPHYRERLLTSVQATMPILRLFKLSSLFKVSKCCMRSSFTVRVVIKRIPMIHILQLLILCIALFLT